MDFEFKDEYEVNFLMKETKVVSPLQMINILMDFEFEDAYELNNQISELLVT